MRNSTVLWLINIFIFIFLMTFFSCRGDHGQREADSDSVIKDSSEVISDSDTLVVEEDPYLYFPTPDSAINYMKNSGKWDRYSKGIIPYMTSYNLPYAEKLLNNEFKRFIVVDKDRMKVFLYDKYGVEEKAYPMVCGKNYGTKHQKADSRTPEGFFSASGIYDSTEWLFTDDNGVTSPKKGSFGPRFIRIKSPITSQIGIHGAGTSHSVGKRLSHGCIRITNDNILELVKLVEVGMPIIVSPGPRDIAVNKDEGYDIPIVNTYGYDKPRNETVKEEVRDTVTEIKVDTTMIESVVPESAPIAEPELSVETDSIN